MRARSILKMQFALLSVALVGAIAMIAGQETDRPLLFDFGTYVCFCSVFGAIAAPLLHSVEGDD